MTREELQIRFRKANADGPEVDLDEALDVTQSMLGVLSDILLEEEPHANLTIRAINMARAEVGATIDGLRE